MPIPITPNLKFLLKRYTRVSDLSFVSGISRSTINRMKRLGTAPSSGTLNKMTKLYNSIQYRSLRTSGASSSQASRFKSRSPAVVTRIRNLYDSTAERISRSTGIDEEFIVDRIAKSSKTAERIFESV